MRQLSNLDASFLSLESQRSPMHIGCILKFEFNAKNKMNFERFQQHVESRLPSSPVFRRRLARLPFELDRPYWIDDRHFNIGNHLQHVQLQGIHSDVQRQSYINAFFSESLNLELPLWEMMFIENRDYKQSEFHVLLKIHHSAVDGMSAEKILTGLMSAESCTPAPLVDDWLPESPSVTRMLSNKVASLVRSPENLTDFVKQLSSSIKRSAQERQSLGRRSPSFFMSPSTLFNKGVSHSKQLNSVQFSLSEIKAIKNSLPDCTVNDVVLAICAGALRKQLNTEGKLPKSPLIAMVPVSKRDGAEDNEGNLISAMLVSLATNVASPLDRLMRIQKNAQSAKRLNKAVSMEKVLAKLPSWSSSWFLKAYTGLRIARNINPVFNLVVTNVPGARVPLYLDGAKLISMEGMAPIVDGMGLMLVVTSYMDSLTISVTTSAEKSIHAKAFIGYLNESMDELRAAISVHQTQMNVA